MKNFALIGAAGYIAPRHMKAIHETGNNLVAALDKHDNVGVLDNYFPNADFFTEFERFDRHIDKLRRSGKNIDYVSICSPNYLHDAHIRFGLRQDADVICEKPLVLNPWNVDSLIEMEKETKRKVNTILQLRLHPSIVLLKDQIDKTPKEKMYDVDLRYITSRGNWYQMSWKGELAKSGGIATNIGIHFFDMLIWIFGDVKSCDLHQFSASHAEGVLQLERARVRWFLSIDYNHLPETIKKAGKRTYRSLTIGNEEVEFSEGFTDLHTLSYQHILSGKGFGISDAKKSIQLVHDIRKSMK
jgi:UDP-N-acetyl-2-amino-2-deoxyglucuronate dehydrogenase